MTYSERLSLEKNIDTSLIRMKMAIQKSSPEDIDNWWSQAIYHASILRTEINDKGVPYIQQKKNNILKAITESEKTRERIYQYLQEIILAKQNRSPQTFKHWYKELTDLI